MKPIDYRNAKWAEIASRLHGDRIRVWEGFRQHGPCTTRELSKAIGLDILTVRPRTTELYQLGLIDVLEAFGNEGVYRAVTMEAAKASFERRAAEARGPIQKEFAL